ncbi:EF-P lysine aminoacylase EpmA [Thiopseudomonas denitrificans]|uniref:Lysyl-tRNA synthetase class 2 n=1 Tax=Thiopseudomonas denitrificans TaxID=1501432 RepID=A0A4R6U1G6_9GAMM|nr:EF-P lysine aminoacylase EpmA [Thiopseudomonas denitrificans]TDQ40238.1 lysyl-tRNA synthetase class 2 [Thiopseudomonas denitrificans]
MHNWQPGAALQNLQARQQLYRSIRDFFYRRGVLEVETPLLNQAPVADPNITPIQADGNRWLHTSPEYAMKRLLCAGSGDIYQICKVFRQGEAGRRHNPEFSMLEWYRVGWSLPQLMQEVAELLQLALAERYPELPVRSYSYRQALQEFAGLDVLSCSDHDIATLGRQLANADLELDRDGWLDVIMSHQVEPALPRNTLVFVDNFPASQAALAKILPQADGAAWAQRFEVFFNGMELANGYDELLDADIQRQRFARELAGTGRPCDERLLAALEQGLPDCSGVALGLDRLLLHATGADNIRQVISFDWYSA